MPIPACCIKGNFYAKSALLYSDVGIRLPHVLLKEKFYAKVIDCHN